MFYFAVLIIGGFSAVEALLRFTNWTFSLFLKPSQAINSSYDHFSNSQGGRLRELRLYYQ